MGGYDATAIKGVYPCYENQFSIDIKGGDGTTESDLKTIADMESFSVSIDGNVEEWNPFDTKGWTRRLVTGKSITISVSGKRNIGDSGNDYVEGLATKTGQDCSTTIVWSFPSGAKLVIAGDGKAQLCLIVDGAVVKTKVYATVVRESAAHGEVVDPPPDTIVQEAVTAYLSGYVDTVTVADKGSAGDLLRSNGDGSYSWLTLSDPVIDSDEGSVLVSKSALNKTHHDHRHQLQRSCAGAHLCTMGAG